MATNEPPILKSEGNQQKRAFHCVSCNKSIDDQYYRVNGKVTCPDCTRPQQELLRPPQGWTNVLRALVCGLAAATLAGALAAWLFASVKVAYKVTEPSPFGFSAGRQEVIVENDMLWWIAEWTTPFIVGIAVSAGIRYATKGRRSRSFAVLAMVLTCVAIISAHIPLAETVLRISPFLKRNILTDGTRSSLMLGRMVDVLSIPVLMALNDPINIAKTLLPTVIAIPTLWLLTAPRDVLIMGPYSP